MLNKRKINERTSLFCENFSHAVTHNSMHSVLISSFISLVYQENEMIFRRIYEQKATRHRTRTSGYVCLFVSSFC